MKVLIVDFYPKQAHRYWNNIIIKAFAKFANVTVISINNYYDDEKTQFIRNNIEVVDLEVKEYSGRVGTRLWCIRIQKRIKKYLRSYSKQYDIMCCLSYDTIAMAFGRNLTKVLPLFLCQHSNIDELLNPIKLKFAKRYLYNTYQIILEQAFKDFLTEQIAINPERIYTIPHPITIQEITDNHSGFIYDCVGLCHANDDSIVQAIVNQGDKYKSNDLCLVLRSKNVVSKVDNIKIINRFLERSEYLEYLKNAKCVFVATPKSYKYRLSGSIYDALALYKVVLTTNDFYPTMYKDMYPNICIRVNGDDDLFDLISSFHNNKYNYNEIFARFIKDHSISKCEDSIRELLANIETKLNIKEG